MAYASYLYRLARSCDSLEGVSRCFVHLGKQTPALHLQRRWLSTSDVLRAAGEQDKDGSASGSGSNSATSSGSTTEQVQQSPFVEAHLASLASQSPQPTEKQASPASSSDSSSSDESSEAATGRVDEDSMFSQAVPASRMFIFDDSTVARVPGEEAAARKPWDSAREAEVKQAEAALKAGRPRRGAPIDETTAQQAAEEQPQEPQFLQPVKYDDLPQELQPRFREIIRKRPAPVRVAEVWEAVRQADHLGQRAKAAGFVPSVDCSISLLIDPRRSDQLIRGTATLPHGTGRDARVAVFTSNSGDADAATAAGAAIVGGDDLVAQVAQDKGIAADTVVATPDMVPRLGKIARILGPKGLMPNPKFGTVTTQVADTVQELRRGKLQFRNDKGGTVSVSIGRKSFSDAELTENFNAFFQAVMDLRPKGLSGQGVAGYVERVSVSTTRGKGFPVHMEDLIATVREVRGGR